MSNYTVSWGEKTKGSSSNYQKHTTTVSASSKSEAKSKALGSRLTNSSISIKGVNSFKH